LQPLEMAKLWKGVYYCFWMSDKPLVQQALAHNLADLTLDVRPKSKSKNGRVERFRSAMTYLCGFWEAIIREWSTLDHHRLDKFLLLIRRFTHVGFRLLEREQWDERAIEEYNAMLVGPGGPLDVTNDKVPLSLAYHLFDIYLDELDRVASSSPDSSTLPLALLSPMYSVASHAPLQVMFTRLVDNVFTPLLDALVGPKPEPNPKRRRGNAAKRAKERAYPALRAAARRAAGVDAVDEAAADARIGKQVLRRLFEEGGKEETGEAQRRRIYNFVTEREVDFEEDE
ncbi:Nop52-domain-containing protein, partial [Rhodotorula sp. JG-1b]